MRVVEGSPEAYELLVERWVFGIDGVGCQEAFQGQEEFLYSAFVNAD